MRRNEGILYWITGLSGAGKTTVGNRLYYELRKEHENVILLDGDILKNIVSDELGYSDGDRRKRAKKYALLCKSLTDQGMIVICCTIAMYEEVRQWNRLNNKVYCEVFLDVPMDVLKMRDQKGMYSQYEDGKIQHLAGVDIKVEYPETPDLVLNNDGSITVKQCVEEILKFKLKKSSNFDRDVTYWNEYYNSNVCPEEPSLFAHFSASNMVKNKNLLELGCGNGRDSVFFAKNGLNVMAIDASDVVISELQKKYNMENLCFICDDFVCSSTLFVSQYDYCYSRFSLHAINEEQESEMIRNVYNSLKVGGMFFIEVRSIHDDLFEKGEKVGRNAFYYDGHYRRFLVKEELESKLSEAGFLIDYSCEDRDFAPYGRSNPPIIRIIAKKCK
ncbi:MAG: adenylyl-sulfate kinase [Lachnospiraceae bacterium]|nr:adenylyl-sulfate kinase [Lachnospiraceae bacterium]